MPRENVLDRITDKLKMRVNRVVGTAQKQFQSVNPYRQKPLTTDERIANYMKWAGTPTEQQLRQQYGDAEVDMVHANMHGLINKKVM